MNKLSKKIQNKQIEIPNFLSTVINENFIDHKIENFSQVTSSVDASASLKAKTKKVKTKQQLLTSCENQNQFEHIFEKSVEIKKEKKREASKTASALKQKREKHKAEKIKEIVDEIKHEQKVEFIVSNSTKRQNNNIFESQDFVDIEKNIYKYDGNAALKNNSIHTFDSENIPNETEAKIIKHNFEDYEQQILKSIPCFFSTFKKFTTFITHHINENALKNWRINFTDEKVYDSKEFILSLCRAKNSTLENNINELRFFEAEFKMFSHKKDTQHHNALILKTRNDIDIHAELKFDIQDFSREDLKKMLRGGLCFFAGKLKKVAEKRYKIEIFNKDAIQIYKVITKSKLHVKSIAVKKIADYLFENYNISCTSFAQNETEFNITESDQKKHFFNYEYCKTAYFVDLVFEHNNKKYVIDVFNVRNIEDELQFAARKKHFFSSSAEFYKYRRFDSSSTFKAEINSLLIK